MANAYPGSHARVCGGRANQCTVLSSGRCSLIGRVGDRMEEMLPRALPRDVPDYHERQAAHFRALASTVTTRRVKTRQLQEAEQHEQIARGEPVLAFADE